MAEESKTVVTLIDETIGLSTDAVDTGTYTLCPIISPNGPTALTYVSGPTQLRNYFNAGSSITPDSEQTLKYARAALNYSPLYIKRASRGNLKGGSTFGKYPTTFYTDAYGNVVDGQIWTFSLNLPEDQTYDTLLDSILTLDSSSMSYIRMDDTVFVAGQNFITSNNDLYKSASSFDASYLLTISDTDATLTDSVTLDIGSSSYTFTAGSLRDQLTDFFISIFSEQSTINPIAIFGTGVAFNSYDDYSYTISDDFTLTAVAFGSEINVTCSNTDDEGIFEAPEEISDAYKLYIYRIYDEEEYTENYELETVDLTFSYDPGTGDEVIQVKTSDVETSSDADYVISISDGTTYGEFLPYVLEQLGTYVTIDTHGTNAFVVVNGSTGLTDNDGANSDVLVSIENLTEPGLDVFGIVSKFPNSGKVITVAITSADDDESLYEMTVTYSNISEEWTFSMLDGAVDGYGNDINYKKINQDSELIEIIPIGGVSTEVQTISIGNEVTGDHLDTTHLIAALEYIQEYEEAPVNFDYILDGGVVDTSYESAILTACETYQSFYLKSCPTDATTSSTLTSSRGNTSSFRMNYIGQCQKESILDSGIDTWPGSLYYFRRRMELANTVQKYTPLFGPSNGDINISSPTVIFTKSDREDMLDSQVMTLRRAMSTGSYYLNDDLTCYKTDSYLQETATVLMVNSINHIAMAYAETLKGKWNTATLRDQVVTYLTNTITQQLYVGTDNGPDSITVVCDSTNNPQTLINQRKLRIDIYGRFNRSIKDVLIYTTIQPLES